jgi:hypothetical protein
MNINSTTNKFNETELIILRYLRNLQHKESLFMIGNIARFKIEKLSHMQNLIDKGYIRQDRRESEKPLSPFSTYYTVPSKRKQIDQLLSQDEKNSMIFLNLSQCKKAKVDDIVPYCFKCKQAYQRGLTYCRKCMDKLESLDVQMLDIITMLNNKGYETSFCCSGHGNDITNIVFKDRKSSITAPKGFRITTTHNLFNIESIAYHKVLGKKRSQLNESEVLEMWTQNMNTLREWVDNLPLQATTQATIQPKRGQNA